jgi:RNA polymerase sigma factor (sigma-70 family)
MNEIDSELKEIARSCLRNDRDAKTRFQNLFGELIYNYPMKMFRLPEDKTADFYVYVFEDGRVFKRLKGFEGRNNAQFKTYLGYYVLRDLFLEWGRLQKDPVTVSLEAPVTRQDSKDEGGTLQDFIPDPSDGPESVIDSRSGNAAVKDVFERIDPEKKLLLKLLHLAEWDFSPEEIRIVCRKSGKTYREVVGVLEDIRVRLRIKDERSSTLLYQLESVFGWILLYQKELARFEEALRSLSANSPKHAELRRDRAELERKLEWRYRQREQMLEKTRQFRLTTSYKDIATLLNVPLGTVCSLVARTRAELLETLGGPRGLHQAIAI